MTSTPSEDGVVAASDNTFNSEPALTEQSITAAAQESPEVADALWRETLPTELRPVALRHGRELFAASINFGLAGEALQRTQTAAQRTEWLLRGAGARQAAQEQSRELHAAVGVLTQVINVLAERLVELSGWTPQQIAECKQDIERAGSLAMASPARSKSGLILPH